MRPNKLPLGDDHDQIKPSFKVVRTLLPYLREFPGRVFVAAVCLILAKLSGVAMPMVLKHIVDKLDASKQTLLVVPLALLFFYGFLRFGNVVLGELRDVVFGRVTERAVRRASLDVFKHLHRLDMDFHLARRTGGVARDIERGVSGISFLLRFMLFNIVPTLLELGLVAVILLVNYGASFAVITALSVGGYILFSVSVTEWRTKFVREANRLDSRASTRAVDSLLNYETVKYFNNEGFETQRYDESLDRLRQASLKSQRSLSLLNTGQQTIIAVGFTTMTVEAAVKVGVVSFDFAANLWRRVYGDVDLEHDAYRRWSGA